MQSSPLRAVSFTDRDSTLDELADSLRSNPRARVMARGLPIEDLFALFMKEQAGRTGSR